MSRIEILTPEGASRQLAAASPAARLAPRLPDLAGRQIALHDNAKPGSIELLTALGTGLQEAGARLRRWSKAHAARPSSHVAEMAATCAAAVFALGD